MIISTQKTLFIVTLDAEEVKTLENLLNTVYPAVKHGTPEMVLLIELHKKLSIHKNPILNNN